MIKPTMQIMIPHQWDYKAREKEIVIYRAAEYHCDEYERDEHDECRYCGEEDCDGTTCENSKAPPIEEMNLQKILDMLPSNIRPEDVKIGLNVSQSSMGVGPTDNSSVYFYYLENTPDRMKQYEIDLAEYEKAYSIYQVELKAYEAYQLQEQISKMKKKLKDLKKET